MENLSTQFTPDQIAQLKEGVQTVASRDFGKMTPAGARGLAFAIEFLNGHQALSLEEYDGLRIVPGFQISCWDQMFYESLVSRFAR